MGFAAARRKQEPRHGLASREACRRRRLGELVTQAHAALDQAARICTAHSLPKLLATIDEMRR